MSKVVNLDDRRPGPTAAEEKIPHDAQSWRPEVIADETGKWTPNALRFATEEEAARWARELSFRWMAVRQHRAAPSSDPVTHRYTGGKLEEVTCT